MKDSSHQPSPISNQQSAINNQQSTIRTAEAEKLGERVHLSSESPELTKITDHMRSIQAILLLLLFQITIPVKAGCDWTLQIRASNGEGIQYLSASQPVGRIDTIWCDIGDEIKITLNANWSQYTNCPPPEYWVFEGILFPGQWNWLEPFYYGPDLRSDTLIGGYTVYAGGGIIRFRVLRHGITRMIGDVNQLNITTALDIFKHDLPLVTVKDYSGKVIFHGYAKSDLGWIDESFPAGLYVVFIAGEYGILTRKVAITH